MAITGSSRPKATPASSSWRAKRDFAARLGLKLDFVQLKTDPIALKALLAGELDSYEGGAGGAMVAAARGADVKVVGCNWLVVPHGVYVRRNIASMRRSQGQVRRGVDSRAASRTCSRVRRSRKRAFALGDVKLAAMGADTDRYKALVAGVVDAAIITNEYDPIAGKEGIHSVMPASRGNAGFPARLPRI